MFGDLRWAGRAWPAVFAVTGQQLPLTRSHSTNSRGVDLPLILHPAIVPLWRTALDSSISRVGLKPRWLPVRQSERCEFGLAAMAASSVSSGKRKLAIDKSWKGDESIAKQPRVKRHPSVAEQTATAIYDHAKKYGLSPMEIDGLEVEGKTLRQRVYEDKAKNQAEDGSVTFGAKYWKALIGMYRQSDAVMKKLEMPADESPCQKFMDTLALCLTAPINRTPFRGWCETVASLSKADVVGMARFLWQLSASASEDQRRTAVGIVECWHRLGAFNAHKVELEALHAKMDEVLLKVGTKCTTRPDTACESTNLCRGQVMRLPKLSFLC